MTAGIALTLATVAGCSGEGSSDRAAPTGATSPAPTLTVAATDYLPKPAPTTPIAPAVDPSIVLGSALRAYLPTARTVPSGWTLDTKYGPATPSDSGTQVLSGTTGLGPAAPCDVMSNMTIVDGEAAYASQQMRSTDGAYAALVTVDSFRTGQATKQLAVIRDFVARCPSYVDKHVGTGGGDVETHLSVEPVDGLGDEALHFKIIPQGAYRTNETVIVRIGDRVLQFRCTSDERGRLPDMESLARDLAKAVK
ncbi:hypothetical protein ABZW03_32155 [Kitasatospora sp. NPDC004799]|uniref:hypothetical protein n=1 Tax=Kitasatospora sp. NPDC004799 TaxID=3154460 RepID=UPI0033A96467